MDYSSVGIVFVFIVLIIIALVVFLKLLSVGGEQTTTRQVNSTPVPMDEGKFLTAFLKPVYDDGLEEMETAVDALKDGLDFYGRGAFVDAGEQFIEGRRSIDAATKKFREVQSLVEDPAIDYAKKARNRLIDCQRLKHLADEMEHACDAQLEKKFIDPRALEEKTADSKKFVEEWKKE